MHFSFSGIKLSGVSTVVPVNTVNIEEKVEQYGEKAVEKFILATGVKERRVASKHQTTSDLGYIAAKKVIEGRIDPNEIGVLVFASHGGDYIKPATSFVLQHRLNLCRDCFCIDIGLGCTGFVSGIQVASSLLVSNKSSKYALLIVGDTNSKIVSEEDASMRSLVGDAASSILIEKCEEKSFINGLVYSDGDKYKNIIVPGGGMRDIEPSNGVKMFYDGNKRGLRNVFMNGMGVFKYAIRENPRLISEYFEHANTSIDDYDFVVAHQANKYILEQLRKRMCIQSDRMLISLDRYGNTSSASIPLTICDRLGEDDTGYYRLLCVGFGVGLSCGVADLCIDSKNIFRIIESDEVYSEGLIRDSEDWLFD